MNIKAIIFIYIVSLYIPSSLVMSKPFSFCFPQEVENIKIQKPSYITTSDSLKIAYYSFLPQNPQSILILYHGGGAWSGKIYQYLATQLQKNYNIGCYLFDIRGHGNSQGPRGDASSTAQVWQDVSSAIDFVTAQHPNVPITLGGHSSGAGLVLNYSSFYSHPSVRSYLFLSPFLGPDSQTIYEHDDPTKRFVHKVRLIPLILNGISNGYLFAHTPAIFFNYPLEEKNKDTYILEYYTCALSSAVTPQDSAANIQKIDKPFAVLIGEKDEQFMPHKIIDCFQKTAISNHKSVMAIIDEAKHLSILYADIPAIANAIENILCL